MTLDASTHPPPAASRQIAQELEREYERFVEFGGVLDRRTRKYLVQYLQNKFDPERHLIPELHDRYYDCFTKALDELFLIDGLLELTVSNQKIRQRIVLDTLQWLRKTHKMARTKHPYQQELQRLEGWSVTPLHIFVGRWSVLIACLKSEYSRDQLDHYFFTAKFKALIGSKTLADIAEADCRRIEVLLHDALAQWDALLSAKILEFQMAKVREEQERHVELMEKKVQEYRRLREFITPFSDYLGWDLSRKLWSETSFDVLVAYDELLRDETAIKELVDLLGNMREAEIEMEEETLERTIIRQEWVSDPHHKAEIVGAHQSDDLHLMLSSEASLLSDPDTESIFLKKYADKQLLTFRYEDKKLVSSEDQEIEVHQRVYQREKGPFIVCIDTSESMLGRPEQIAKVLTLGILKMAMRQNRKAFLINFSVGIETLDLYDIATSIDEIAAFLNKSFYAGTDATLALGEALSQLGTDDYEDADVLVVSDFIMHKMQDKILRQIAHYQQNKGTQFHCLTLGEYGNAEILHFFDTNWTYDPAQKGVIRSLTRDLADIGG